MFEINKFRFLSCKIIPQFGKKKYHIDKNNFTG